MTRILTDIPDEDIKWLDQLAAEQGRSRAALLREAVQNYRHGGSKDGFEKYFGLWERHGSTVDGLEYERQFRDEWPNADDIAAPTKKPDFT